MVLHSADGTFAIRKGPWKWVEGVPVSDIKPGVRKSRANEFKPQLFNLQEDPAETTDLSTKHPEVVKELSALLNRYRDGGYSRELPPVVVKKDTALLPPPTGTVLLEADFKTLPPKPWSALQGTWQPREDALWGAHLPQQKNGAALRGPLPLTDGVLQYDLKLHTAGRHSLRIHTAGGKRSFRIVVSTSRLEITKNPAPGEGQEHSETLAEQKLHLNASSWYSLRITFAGETLTAQIDGVSLNAKHPLFSEPKEQLNLLVFDGEAGFRNLQAVKP